MSSTFQRARSEEQRAERRLSILRTAREMLVETTVAKMSLNELSRRVGLAKSNVLRYFETREAVLLALLNEELDDWVDELEGLEPAAGSPEERGQSCAFALASTLAARPVLCDLVSAQASVLEHNISVEVAVVHKRATSRTVGRLQDVLAAAMPELDNAQTYHVIATTLLMCSAAWPQSNPSAAVVGAYECAPELANFQTDFTEWMTDTLRTTIRGLLTA